MVRGMALGALLALVPVAAVAGSDAALPRDAAAYALFPPPAANGLGQDYLIGPLDVIAVTVFQEPDLTVKDLPVDSGGNVVLPLIGSVHAAGQTPTQFAHQIAGLLSRKMLVGPQVAVVVQESVSQKVTVGGSVTEPGVYELKGPTTLLEALALAKGPTRIAQMNQVAVFRTEQGRKIGAMFDIKKISRGQAPDPEIRGNDMIVVGSSGIKAAWRDILTASPLAAALRGF